MMCPALEEAFECCRAFFRHTARVAVLAIPHKCARALEVIMIYFHQTQAGKKTQHKVHQHTRFPFKCKPFLPVLAQADRWMKDFVFEGRPFSPNAPPHHSLSARRKSRSYLCVVEVYVCYKFIMWINTIYLCPPSHYHLLPNHSSSISALARIDVLLCAFITAYLCLQH